MDFSASAVLQRIRNSLQNPANRLEGGFAWITPRRCRRNWPAWT